VVQTHLFHDRIMRMDTVVLGTRRPPLARNGPVALPAARLGRGAVTIGPASAGGCAATRCRAAVGHVGKGNPIRAVETSSGKTTGKKAVRGAATEDTAA